MGRRLGWVAWVLIPVLALVVVGWVSGGHFGGATGWVVDGAAADTHWDAAVVDLPGVAIGEVHCHGKMRYVVQLGDAGPVDNPCERRGPGNHTMSMNYVMDLPGGKGLFRYRVDSGPWRYFASDRSNGWPPGIPTPPGWPYQPSPPPH